MFRSMSIQKEIHKDVYKRQVLNGELDLISYLLISMLPLFLAKLETTIFVDLTSYKNLTISKRQITSIFKEPEETGSMKPLSLIHI